ncbi:unnamed protein product [Allacma fusca]|uniref:FHF complex subunit HOOK-interacting protein C-terminal domain-containing protein n=1 Tax=Allacma fusca TaxID=39272 RepID=A0A8J2NIW6_9HEXA|nr:unnamed protein product [Allacma fusca]
MSSWLRNKLVIERKKMEPEATFSSFKNHWMQALDKIQTTEESLYSEAALAVISNLTQMIALLRVARDEAPEHSCKSFWIQNQCSDRVLNWLHDLKNKGLQLSREDDERLVMMLHALCELASRDGEILGYLRSNSDLGAIPWDGACSLASLLLEYSLGNELTLGETAKYSFILLIKLASRYPALERSLSQESGIGYTNLVISGLCACFAQLPTYAHGSSEQMRPFVQQLKFVDDISHAAPDRVATGIADCFSSAFLDAIIQPALIQDEGNHSLHKRHDPYVTSVYEEEAVVTRYLQTICELLTHPMLVQRLMNFVISMNSATFLQRLNHSNVSVTVSTLSLYNSLLNFYCEDFWFHVVLKYLLPQNHRMGQLRKTRVAEIDFHDSSIRFLRLIPKCIVEAIGPDKLTHHYGQYLSSESRRLASLDSIGLGFLTPTATPTKESDFSTNATLSTNSNPVYPKWKLKYDGTDDITSPNTSPKNAPVLLNGDGRDSDSNSLNLESGNFSLANIKAESKGSELLTAVVTKQKDPLGVSDSSDGAVFTTVSLLQSGVDDLSSIGLSEQSFDSCGSSDANQHVNITNDKISHDFGALSNDGGAPSEFDTSSGSDGYLNMSNGRPSKGIETSASFGPFLDCLLHHLANMTVLDPDVILMVTEILSLIAASRIPLVNSLFLDPTLIIQPSYPSFASLLNRIQAEFDQCLSSHPQVIQEVWTLMTRERKISNSSMSSYTSNFDDSVSINSYRSTGSVTDNIRRKMISGASIAAKGFSLLGFNKPPNNSNASLQASLQESQESLQPLGGQGYMYTNYQNRAQSPPQISSDPTRVMATRAIFFTHWLLELAAISQQLCWKRT